MIKLYNELYLNKARDSLAMMLDYAVQGLRQDADEFFDLFISTGTAQLFEHGDVRIIAGMSGIELAYHVLGISGIPHERAGYRYTQGRSKEYWAGWALAYYQWEHAIPFSHIVSCIPLSRIIHMCDSLRSEEIHKLSEGLSWMDTLVVPDHMNEENYAAFSLELNGIISSAVQETNLRKLRLKSGLSQSKLAAASGVPVRTIQQYEQRQKDINRAGFESIIKLAAALGCEPVSLLERSISELV